MWQAGTQAAREGSLSLSELRTLYLDLLRRPPFDALLDVDGIVTVVDATRPGPFEAEPMHPLARAGVAKIDSPRSLTAIVSHCGWALRTATLPSSLPR